MLASKRLVKKCLTIIQIELELKRESWSVTLSINNNQKVRQNILRMPDTPEIDETRAFELRMNELMTKRPTAITYLRN